MNTDYADFSIATETPADWRPGPRPRLILAVCVFSAMALAIALGARFLIAIICVQLTTVACLYAFNRERKQQQQYLTWGRLRRRLWGISLPGLIMGAVMLAALQLFYLPFCEAVRRAGGNEVLPEFAGFYFRLGYLIGWVLAAAVVAIIMTAVAVSIITGDDRRLESK